MGGGKSGVAKGKGGGGGAAQTKGIMGAGNFLNAIDSAKTSKIREALGEVSPGTEVTLSQGDTDIQYRKNANGTWRVRHVDRDTGLIEKEIPQSDNSVVNEITKRMRSGTAEVSRFNLITEGGTNRIPGRFAIEAKRRG